MLLEKFKQLSLAKKSLTILLIIVIVVIIYTVFISIGAPLRNNYSYDRINTQSVGLAKKSSGISVGLAPSGIMQDSVRTSNNESFEKPNMPSTASGDRKVIKTANLDISVNEVEQTVTKITADTSAAGGFIQNSSVTENTKGQKFASLVLRVPVTKFENQISQIKSYAKLVEREDIRGREVTEEYNDLNADLKHQEAVETQYLKLLKRANEVEEIIAVRNKLDQVQREIERIKGRLRYLDNQTDMSTITVHISSEFKVTLPADKWQPWENVKRSTSQLIVSLQNFVDWTVGSIFWLISLIPYLVIFLIIYLVGRKIYKKKLNQQIK